MFYKACLKNCVNFITKFILISKTFILEIDLFAYIIEILMIKHDILLKKIEIAN